jgi:hypothetical protein
MLKVLFSNICIFILCNLSTAQSPQLVPYQAIARDNAGNPVINQNIGLRFSIHDQTITGTVVWQENQTVVSNTLGIIVTAIGGTTSLTAVDWGNGSKFLQVEMDITGGTNYIDMGTQQMMSVPYALYAETSGSVINNNNGGGNGSFTHWIGELYQGGIICHLWKDVQGIEHGLIASLVDLGYDPNTSPYGVQFQETPGLDNNLIDAYVINPYDGEEATNYIQNFTNLSLNNPAKLCLDFQNEGFTNWYLPSVLELEIMWSHIHVLNYVLINIPEADIIGCAQANGNSNTFGWGSSTSPSNRYWSSSYLDATSWFYRDMALLVAGSNSSLDASIHSTSTSSFLNVRALRKF